MKITADEIRDERSLLGHIVLEGVVSHASIIEAIVRDNEAEVILTVNGMETDLRAFVNHWQSQVERMIKEEAVKIVEEKFYAVRDKMFDFERALERSIGDLTC